MSRPPPLKPIRSGGETRANFSESGLLQPIEEDSQQTGTFHTEPSSRPDASQRLKELTPLSWSDFFQARALVLPDSCKGLGFRVYTVGSVTELLSQSSSSLQTSTSFKSSLYPSSESSTKQPLLLLFHGGGYSALSFGLLVKNIMKKLPQPTPLSILAFDARGHGETELENEQDLSAERQVEDALSLLKCIYGELDSNLPPIVLAGHSMGGAVAVRVGASGRIPTLRGLVVIDVVEGTAISSLPHMQSVLLKRPKSFSSVEKAILHALETKQTKSKESCRLSLPSQLKWNDEKNCYNWRTNLEESECYWKGWFENLSSLFLQVDVPKLLILAGQDRLDKPLTIAQMQGRFQLSVVRDSGHNLHEDQPEATAQIFVDFLRRHMIIN
ncbi:hypothetical protein GAYE_SCF54G6251 [Galdieria yellowstonensis]|uniref:Protein phosphatase methylesterase 1 n=1 Tax=Galdieria yellowstonensis TaxID=3028027 RepID=A0AAV9IM25_9RHOD|nr:hypothetical protein GAYE_SCF54G6251 [Galdieria yellowstonensis]